MQIRPILFMIGSMQNELSTCLEEILESVLQLYSNNIFDSFRFVRAIRELNAVFVFVVFIVSYVAVSLFTNVPFEETTFILMFYIAAILVLLGFLKIFLRGC